MTGTHTPLYRSPGLAPGALRQLGTIHMHVDGAGYRDLVATLVQELERGGALAKLTAITKSVAGPQRDEEPETYASHTAGSLQQEHLEYFSSSSLGDRDDAVRTLIKIIPLLTQHKGVVIEVERIIATMDEEGWHNEPIKDRPIKASEVGFDNNATLPFEIHHAIDFQTKQGQRPPLDIEVLLKETTALGLRVGGWFNFLKRDGVWSFRSNAFTRADNLEHAVTMQYRLIDAYLADKHLECPHWVIVEQVLGIWRSPFRVALASVESEDFVGTSPP